MESSILYIQAKESGDRVDALLACYLEDISRSGVQKLLDAGLIRLDDRPIRKNYRCSAGDLFQVTLPEPEAIEPVPQDLPLSVVFEDEDVIVVNKQRGMVVHPAPGHADGTLVNALLYHCGDSLSGIGGAKRPGIVHRIDKDTSGLLIVAKNDFSHQNLSLQLSDHSLYREYEAVCCGNLRSDTGSVDAPIGRDPKERKRMAVTEHNSKPAVTHWSMIRRYRGYSHISCRLETGRTHQIRVHLSSLGHPLLGDGLYGAKCPDKGLEGQCLHARRLTFHHPRSGELITLSCELPEYFQRVLTHLGPPCE